MCEAIIKSLKQICYLHRHRSLYLTTYFLWSLERHPLERVRHYNCMLVTPMLILHHIPASGSCLLYTPRCFFFSWGLTWGTDQCRALRIWWDGTICCHIFLHIKFAACILLRNLISNHFQVLFGALRYVCLALWHQTYCTPCWGSWLLLPLRLSAWWKQPITFVEVFKSL